MPESERLHIMLLSLLKGGGGVALEGPIKEIA